MTHRSSTMKYGDAAPTAARSTLPDELFGIEPNIAVMHQVVTAQLAASALGHAQHQDPRRGRAAVARSRGARRAPAAPARARSASPQWRGGGVAHGPKPRDYRSARPRR